MLTRRGDDFEFFLQPFADRRTNETLCAGDQNEAFAFGSAVEGAILDRTANRFKGVQFDLCFTRPVLNHLHCIEKRYLVMNCDDPRRDGIATRNAIIAADDSLVPIPQVLHSGQNFFFYRIGAVARLVDKIAYIDVNLK